MLAGSVANAEIAHAFVKVAKTTGKWCVDAGKLGGESLVPGGWRPACWALQFPAVQPWANHPS